MTICRGAITLHVSGEPISGGSFSARSFLPSCTPDHARDAGKLDPPTATACHPQPHHHSNSINKTRGPGYRFPRLPYFPSATPRKPRRGNAKRPAQVRYPARRTVSMFLRPKRSGLNRRSDRTHKERMNLLIEKDHFS